jgi:high-affinity Fe2+/Pb2+ permease
MSKTDLQNSQQDSCRDEVVTGSPAEEPSCRDEAWRLTEVGVWPALALTPLLYWTNGPAVFQDQFIVRGIVVLVVILGVAALQIRALLRTH